MNEIDVRILIIRIFDMVTFFMIIKRLVQALKHSYRALHLSNQSLESLHFTKAAIVLLIRIASWLVH